MPADPASAQDYAQQLIAEGNLILAGLAAAGSSSAEVAALQAQVTNLTMQLATANGTIADLQETIDVLEAQLATYQLTTSSMLVGATIDRRGTETQTQAIVSFEDAIGAEIGIRRVFESSTPSSWASSRAAIDSGQRAVHLSFKGTPTAAAFDALITSAPNDGYKKWLTWQHEPENDGGSMTPTYFKSGQALLLARIEASGRTDIIPTFVLMSWLERDSSGTTTSADWFPAQPSKWVMAIDPYDDAGNLTLAQAGGPTLALWRQPAYAGPNGRWAIAETATVRTGSAGASWINAGVDWARDNRAEFFCYFHSAVGSIAPPNGWWIDNDPVRSAAFGTWCPSVAYNP